VKGHAAAALWKGLVVAVPLFTFCVLRFTFQASVPMPARLLDGTTVGSQIRESLRPRISSFTARHGRQPGLGIVLAGDDPASEIYVGSKLKSADDAGCRTDLIRLPATASLDEALDAVRALNASDAHDGILVQSPLPKGMGSDAEQIVFDTIDPAKDVDGFTPVNVGLLVQNRAVLVSCTPAGIIQLLERSGIDIRGSHAVVIGRSDIVGKPMALLLLHRHATVTICHSRTVDLPDVVRRADLVVAAIGRTAFVQPAWVKPGATIVDVGINRVTDRAEVERLFPPDSPRRAVFEKRGSVVVGDVHPGAMTPVPGGVGPLTIAMLLNNTLAAAEQRAGSGVHT
jgi:methylenetetrahydrofolate dehydrogenase (NADP+) / methenyltetrahydrofolate cyclohydrolase